MQIIHMHVDGNYDRFESLTHLEDSGFYVVLLDKDELMAHGENLGLPKEIEESMFDDKRLHKNLLKVSDEYSYGKLQFMHFQEHEKYYDGVGLFLNPKRLVMIKIDDEDGSLDHIFDQSLTSRGGFSSPGRFLAVFLNHLISTHTLLYDVFQGALEELDDGIFEGHYDKTTTAKLLQANHNILQIYTNYEQMIDFCGLLLENNNGVLEEPDIQDFRYLINRLSRFSDHFKVLREYGGQIRAAYQSQLDIDTNKTMKIFTVISAIFLPLTLLVGWYGMNFISMPEFTWAYGYHFVIVLAIVIVIVCTILIRRNRLI